MNQKQIRIRNRAYRAYADNRAEKSPAWLNCCKAFLVGGGICLFGECLFSLFRYLHFEEDTCRLLVSVFLVLITAVLTGLGVFDTVAKFAGAGTLVPITGFANAVVSPAIDNRSEGLILGLGAKIFLISGPVILYGILASVLYGIIYCIITLL